MRTDVKLCYGVISDGATASAHHGVIDILQQKKNAKC